MSQLIDNYFNAVEEALDFVKSETNKEITMARIKRKRMIKAILKTLREFIPIIEDARSGELKFSRESFMRVTMALFGLLVALGVLSAEDFEMLKGLTLGAFDNVTGLVVFFMQWTENMKRHREKTSDPDTSDNWPTVKKRSGNF